MKIKEPFSQMLPGLSAGLSLSLLLGFPVSPDCLPPVAISGLCLGGNRVPWVLPSNNPPFPK